MTKKPIVFFIIFSFLLLDFSVQTAKAQMITLETALEDARQEDSRTRIAAFLSRQDVQQTMVEQGVDPEEAAKRIAALSNREAMNLAKIIDQLPAGGDGFGSLIGAFVLVFFVLLITDILGYTKIFPFVNR
jgi:hypothetical protein